MNLDFQNALTLLSEKITQWYEVLIKSIPNLIAAISVFIIFTFLAKLVKMIVKKLVPTVTKNRSICNLLNSIAYLTVLTLGLFISLEILNLEKTVTSILAGAGVIGLALGFAFQEIASNFVSGILIAFREPYQIGDIVKIQDYFGEVTKINLRTTRITTFQGLEVLIPNKYMFTEPFINYTTTPKRRLDISIGVSYGDDLKKVYEVTKSALERVEHRIKEIDIEVYFEEFGSSSINLSARLWVEYPKNMAILKARHQAIMNIKEDYDKNGITIPFPIRTIDLGIKGGKSLEDVLEKQNV